MIPPTTLLKLPGITDIPLNVKMVPLRPSVIVKSCVGMEDSAPCCYPTGTLVNSEKTSVRGTYFEY